MKRTKFYPEKTWKAAQRLAAAGIDFTKDSDELTSSEMDAVLAEAKAYGYRKPKNANGSTGRYFFQYLRRAYGEKPIRDFLATDFRQ